MQAVPKKTQPHLWGITGLRVVTGYLFLVAGLNNLFTVYDSRNMVSSLLFYLIFWLFYSELLCGAALLVGLFTRWVSIPLAFLMLANILVVHPPDELLTQDKGYEYAALRLAACFTLALTGSNRMALDNILPPRRGPK
jgi:putative oxidoreductase